MRLTEIHPYSLFNNDSTMFQEAIEWINAEMITRVKFAGNWDFTEYFPCEKEDVSQDDFFRIFLADGMEYVVRKQEVEAFGVVW